MSEQVTGIELVSACRKFFDEEWPFLDAETMRAALEAALAVREPADARELVQILRIIATPWRDECWKAADALEAQAGEIVALKKAGNEAYTERAELIEALLEFDDFAWSAVRCDCEEARANLQRKIDRARDVLEKMGVKL